MNNIILQFALNNLPEIEKKMTSQMNNGEDIGQMAETVLEAVLKLGVSFLKEFVETKNNDIKNAKERSKTHYVDKDIESSFLTRMGFVKYTKTIFENRESKASECLVDLLLGITPHEILASDVEKQMLSEAIQTSYRESGEEATYTDDKVSKQSVKELIDKYDFEYPLLYPIDDNKKRVKYLYIEADEDHVAAQHGPVIMPRLIYVHEGIKKENFKSKRNKLINPWYFSSTFEKPYEIWQDVHDYINEIYNWEDIETIYIAGDGASWIKTGLNTIGKTKFVLDRHHMNAYRKRATAHLDEVIEQQLKDALDEGNEEYFEEIFEKILEQTTIETKRKSVLKARNYFRNNWDGVKVYEEDGYRVIGCSAESHISHIYSSRFSSRPKGWSKESVSTIAKLIVYKRNGGDLSKLVEIRRKNKIIVLNENRKDRNQSKLKGEETAKKILNNYYNNSDWQEFANGKQTGLIKALKGLRGAV